MYLYIYFLEEFGTRGCTRRCCKKMLFLFLLLTKKKKKNDKSSFYFFVFPKKNKKAVSCPCGLDGIAFSTMSHEYTTPVKLAVDLIIDIYKIKKK